MGPPMRFVLALLFLVRLAQADVGVVVTGDPNMQARVLDHVQRWLQDKKHEIVAAPLGASSTTLVDCFVMEDMACAKKIVAEKATAANIVLVRVDMSTGQSRDYTLTAYWFSSGLDPASEKRSCTQCDDSALNAAVEGLMQDLSRKGSRGKGTIKISGSGDGMIVKIDGEEIGAPPLEKSLDAGSHEIVFVYGGAPVDVRRVEVDAGGTVELAAPHVTEKRRSAVGKRSRLVPALLTVGGLAAAAAGGVLLYYGSLHGPDEPYIYTNAAKIGLPLAIAGAFALGAATSLWFAGSGSDAQVGVSGTF